LHSHNYWLQKSSSDLNQSLIAGNVSLNEVKEWGKWYEKSINRAPKLLFDNYQTTILNNRFYMRVPLENSKGMIYFTKTNSLQAVFIRPNFKTNSDGIKERANTEFIDVNTNNYKVITYSKNKPDSIYSFVFKTTVVKNEGIITQGTFWFDLGCILSFGIPRWGENGERECWGVDWAALGTWFASIFNDDGSSGDGGDYGGGWGDGGLGDGGYDPGFNGNPSWPDPNNPGWGGGGGTNSFGSVSSEPMTQTEIDVDITNSNFSDPTLEKPRPNYNDVKNACLQPPAICDWLCVANTIGKEVKDQLIKIIILVRQEFLMHLIMQTVLFQEGHTHSQGQIIKNI